MAPKTYRQLCSVARALDVVGERWTLLLVRDLLLGPQSYSALLEGLPGMTTNLLAKRLKRLQAAGLIEALEVKLATPGRTARRLYALTEAGAALAPVVGALSAWGEKHGAPPAADATLNHRWFLVLLGRHYRPSEKRWMVQLNSDDHPFQLRLGTKEYESVQGAPWKPDLIISAAPQTLHALLSTQEDPEEFIRSGRIKLEGAPQDQAQVWNEFLFSFRLRD